MLKYIAFLIVTAVALAQAPKAGTPPKVAAPAKAAAPGIVDSVIELKGAGMTDVEIIKALQRENKPREISMSETLKLKKAGVSDAVIDAIANPKAASVTAGAGAAPAPPKANAVPPAPVAPASAALPPSGQATPFPPDLSSTQGVRKRRLAVKPFDYSTVRTWVSYWFNTDYNIGEGIRSMLVTRMHQSKNITLLERTNIADVMKEQDFGGTNRVKKGTAAKKGNISGADVILYGDIVIFGRDDKAKKGGGSAAIWNRVPVVGGKIAAVSGISKEEKAVVGINLRMVDAETGEVIETAEARGESSRKSKDYSGLFGAAGAGAAAGNGGMTSSNFESTIIGEATSDAVSKVVAFLEGKVPALPAKDRSIEGRIANIADPATVYLNVGEDDAVLTGDRFEVLQVEKQLTDPATKEVIDVVATKVGELVVSTVRERTAICTYGGKPLSQEFADRQDRGYVVRLVTK